MSRQFFCCIRHQRCCALWPKIPPPQHLAHPGPHTTAVNNRCRRRNDTLTCVKAFLLTIGALLQAAALQQVEIKSAVRFVFANSVKGHCALVEVAQSRCRCGQRHITRIVGIAAFDFGTYQPESRLPAPCGRGDDRSGRNFGYATAKHSLGWNNFLLLWP